MIISKTRFLKHPAGRLKHPAGPDLWNIRPDDVTSGRNIRPDVFNIRLDVCKIRPDVWNIRPDVRVINVTRLSQSATVFSLGIGWKSYINLQLTLSIQTRTGLFDSSNYREIRIIESILVVFSILVSLWRGMKMGYPQNLDLQSGPPYGPHYGPLVKRRISVSTDNLFRK